MSVFNFFKKDKKPFQYFSFPKNEEGFNQIVDWIKQCSEVIIDVSSDNKIMIMSLEEGQSFIYVYTDVTQRIPSYKKNDCFITLDYTGLVQIFEDNLSLNFVWLNPHSDSVQLNRSLFTSTYLIKKNTSVQIGQPANPPIEIINFLINYASKNNEIEKVYFALMCNDGNFSFVVTIVSPQSKKIIKSIGSTITKICLVNNIPYPVDFFYNDMIIDEQYQIYSKKN